MDAGLVTSMSGALAQAKRVEVIANNLANADTPAYKRDGLSFEESLMGANQADARSDIPEEPYKESELFSRSGDERTVVLYGNEFTELRSGAMKSTNNPLDVAIEGNGFLEVLTPNGVRLTRAGNLALDPQGRLCNRDGFLVLGAGGGAANADPAMRAITVGSGNVNIDKEGNIYGAEGATLGRLSLVQIDDPGALTKEAGNLFKAPPEAIAKPQGNGPGAAPQTRAPAGVADGTPTKPNPLGSSAVAPRVHQGMLEGSNVNPVTEMTNMIEAHRLFDQNSKLMQTHGDMMSRLSEIGKF